MLLDLKIFWFTVRNTTLGKIALTSYEEWIYIILIKELACISVAEEWTFSMFFKIKYRYVQAHFSSCFADLFLNFLFSQYVPPDLCICNFVLEQSLSVRALQEMLANTGDNASDGVSKLTSKNITFLIWIVVLISFLLPGFSMREASCHSRFLIFLVFLGHYC